MYIIYLTMGSGSRKIPSKRKTMQKHQIFFSIDTADYNLLEKYMEEYKFKPSELYKLIFYNGIEHSEFLEELLVHLDIKKIARLRKLRQMRKLKGFERNEEISKILFENRLKNNIWKLIRLNASFQEVMKVINIYYQESCFYDDCLELNKSLQKWRTFQETEFSSLRREIIKTLPMIIEHK